MRENEAVDVQVVEMTRAHVPFLKGADYITLAKLYQRELKISFNTTWERCVGHF